MYNGSIHALNSFDTLHLLQLMPYFIRQIIGDFVDSKSPT